MNAYNLNNFITLSKMYTSKTSEVITYVIIVLSALAFICLVIHQIHSRHK